MPDANLPDTVDFNFQHRIFSLDGCVFRKTSGDDTIALFVPMGEVMAALQINQIKLEFEIDPDSEDQKLMDLAAQALQYVRQVYPGDSIPSEVINGKAPWMVEEKHLRLAKARLDMLIVSWKTSEDISKIKQSDLVARAESDETKKMVDAAYEEIADALEIEENKREQVLELLEKLAQELSYVEALREKFREILNLQVKLKGLYSTYQTEKSISESISRRNSLLEVQIRQYFEKFDEFDTYMAEIISILRRFEAQVTFIRGERDAFRQTYVLWEDMLNLWNTFEGGRNAISENLVRETYRFAAQHFVRTDDW
ncbi:MAG: hypothetical protein ACI82H_002148 [Alphaproteobacteria bacterium]|jgi:hypothetical protein